MGKQKGKTPERSSTEQKGCPNVPQKKPRRCANDQPKQEQAESLINENKSLEEPSEKKKRETLVQFDNIDKGKTPERRSARLSAKRNNEAVKFEAEKKRRRCANDPQEKKRRRCANDPQEKKRRRCTNDQQKQQQIEQSEKNKRGTRVTLDDIGKQRLCELNKYLNFRTLGAAMDWLPPYDTKSLFDLTNKLDFENGGQTIDWLLLMTSEHISILAQELGYQNPGQTVDWFLPEDTNRLIQVSRELGFTEIAETTECLLEMATHKPLLELSNSLGFQDCRKTIEWLLNDENHNIVATNNADLPRAGSPPLPSAQSATRYPSPVNIPPLFLQNQLGHILSSSNPNVTMHNNNQPAPHTFNVADLKPAQSLMHQTFGNHGVAHEMIPPSLNVSCNQFHVGQAQGGHDQFRMINSEPPHPFQFENGTNRWLRENPQQNPFQNNVNSQQNPFQTNGNPWMAGQDVSMQQSGVARNLSNSNTVLGSNNNHLDHCVDINRHIPGHPNMQNVIVRRSMEDGYLGNQLQPPPLLTRVGGNPPDNVDLGRSVFDSL